MDQNTHRLYAVKSSRFTQTRLPSVAMRECQVADHIMHQPHPCIVQLLLPHIEADTGRFELVMEFCDGGDLAQRIRTARHEALLNGYHYAPPRQANGWLGQVFLALEHLHVRMRTLMRDLKPENVVLTATGRAKLTDFGFGRIGVESTGAYSFGIPTGSPGYVAPEILRQQPHDSKADLYSLGVLIWTLLTGGVTNECDPMPPRGRTGRRRGGRDYSVHFEDWHKLAECVKDPYNHHARPLEESAQELVSDLIQRAPFHRPGHQEIRNYNFMRMLRLPLIQDGPAEVEEWLQSLNHSASSADIVD